MSHILPALRLFGDAQSWVRGAHYAAQRCNSNGQAAGVLRHVSLERPTESAS